jgi:hypothetical protein
LFHETNTSKLIAGVVLLPKAKQQTANRAYKYHGHGDGCRLPMPTATMLVAVAGISAAISLATANLVLYCVHYNLPTHDEHIVTSRTFSSSSIHSPKLEKIVPVTASS